MSLSQIQSGLDELRKARRESRALFLFMVLFSFFVNLLMLTGPLFMLQVYDRVLSSRSRETLLALFLLVAFLYASMGILDYLRGRVMARVGARFQDRLERRVFSAVLRAGQSDPRAGQLANTAMQDLDAVQGFMASPVLMAICDMPWTPVFLAGIFLFHPWLGGLAVAGGVVLVVITIANQLTTKRPVVDTAMARREAEIMAQEIRTEAETIQSLGMRDAAFDRWRAKRIAAQENGLRASDRAGGFTITTKTFRQFLQSGMLALGALLVLLEEMTPGAMIAGSILLGRALAPVEQSIGGWSAVQNARKGWRSLGTLLTMVPPEIKRTALPRPASDLRAEQVSVVPPGDTKPTLRGISFNLPAGQALGVIGPSGSGKSSLARAITGVWGAAGGTMRLGGAALDQFDPDMLGQYVGYLPQKVQLFDGTVAENIARLAPDRDDEQVVVAAKRAAAHEMILDLPNGYDTRISGAGGQLSGGQIQRIGLARALYTDPVLMVLDEPNSNLDNRGSEALNAAIRAMKQSGRAVVIMAHRPAAIRECDLLLVLEGGVVKAFGPRDEVLQKTVRNHGEIAKTKGQGGVS